MTKELTVEPKKELVNGNTGEMLEIGPSMQEISGRLKGYMETKEKKIFFNGKRYPEFDDWQFVAQSYGLKVKTFDPRFVEIGGHRGFHAKAMVIDEKQNEVGRAESYCMDDEPNWRSKPLFQLASMAQTRAGAKALSNLFRPIARLSGYEGTPAEEIMDEEKVTRPASRTPQQIEALGQRLIQTPIPPSAQEIDDAEEVMSEAVAESAVEFASAPPQAEKKRITEKQTRFLWAKMKQANVPENVFRMFLKETFGVEHSNALDRNEMEKTLQWIEKYHKMSGV